MEAGVHMLDWASNILASALAGIFRPCVRLVREAGMEDAGRYTHIYIYRERERTKKHTRHLPARKTQDTCLRSIGIMQDMPPAAFGPAVVCEVLRRWRGRPCGDIRGTPSRKRPAVRPNTNPSNAPFQTSGCLKALGDNVAIPRP